MMWILVFKCWDWDAEDALDPVLHLEFKEHVCLHCFDLLQVDVVVLEQLYALHHLMKHIHIDKKSSMTKKTKE